ncbi:hypothetical protein JCM24511_05602 [Saitozyma sp. JCM 24511]|nr:hypothetical protein JCM24511_05602 [Saitozyma sp. JCM 24511]
MSAHPPLTPVGSALAGALGAVFSNAVVYPLDTVKTRLQALSPSELNQLTGEQAEPSTSAPSGLPAPGSTPTTPRKPAAHDVVKRLPRALLRRLRKWQMLSLLIRILRTEGVSGAFKGFSANMINTFSQQFAYFFFHTFLRTTSLRQLSARGKRPVLSTSSELFLGALAGGLAQIFTIPVAVIATRQQLWMPPPSAGKAAHQRPPTFAETAREVIAEGGPTALWTGLRPGLVLTVNPAITYGVFERSKSWVLSGERQGGKLGTAEAFWLGVMSKTLATVVTYPYIFAKVRLQAKQTGPAADANQPGGASYASIASAPASSDATVADLPLAEGEPSASTQPPLDTPAKPATRAPRGAVALLQQVYREQGFAGWYQGLGAQIVKAVLCQGILFVSKEKFENYAWIIISLLSRFRTSLNP